MRKLREGDLVLPKEKTREAWKKAFKNDTRPLLVEQHPDFHDTYLVVFERGTSRYWSRIDEYFVLTKQVVIQPQ